MIKYENGNRVFVVRNSDEVSLIEGGGMVSYAATYISDTGKKSQYPTVLMGVGDKVFVQGGKLCPKDKVYRSATNRKVSDPSFDYVAYSRKFDGESGFMIRCVERKKPT